MQDAGDSQRQHCAARCAALGGLYRNPLSVDTEPKLPAHMGLRSLDFAFVELDYRLSENVGPKLQSPHPALFASKQRRPWKKAEVDAVEAYGAGAFLPDAIEVRSVRLRA